MNFLLILATVFSLSYAAYSDLEKEAMLDAHNYYRGNVEPEASSMAEMVRKNLYIQTQDNMSCLQSINIIFVYLFLGGFILYVSFFSFLFWAVIFLSIVTTQIALLPEKFWTTEIDHYLKFFAQLRVQESLSSMLLKKQINLIVRAVFICDL